MAESTRKPSISRKSAGRTATSPDGVFLSEDGTLNMAILKFKTDQLGKGMDFRGIHHFGVLVEDVDAFTKKARKPRAEHYVDQGQDGHQAGYFEKKFFGPEGVLFDIAEHGWAGAEPLPVAVDQSRRRIGQGDRIMAKLRHIAIACKDPDAMADFYIKASRLQDGAAATVRSLNGHHISDGTIDLAILRSVRPDRQRAWTTPGCTISASWSRMFDRPRSRSRRSRQALHGPGRRGAGRRLRGQALNGPEGVLFDVAEHPWTGSEALRPR